jgi:superfamily II DNA/RNA helicase
VGIAAEFIPKTLAERVVRKLEKEGHIGALGLTKRDRGITGVKYQIICTALTDNARCDTHVSYSFSWAGESHEASVQLSTRLKDKQPSQIVSDEKHGPKIRLTKSVAPISVRGKTGYFLVKVSIENESKRIVAKELGVSESFGEGEILVDDEGPRISTENLIFEDISDRGRVTFNDHIVLREQHLSIRQAQDKFADFASRNEIPKELVQAMRFEHLLLHQAEAYDVMKKLSEKFVGKSPDKSVLISVRTAGGKTEAFLLFPLSQLIKNPRPGVRLIIMYPTKALANDQAKRIFRYIGRINRTLGETRVTMGIYHGDTVSDFDEVKSHPFKRCPLCGGPLTLQTGGSRFLLSCGKCGDFPEVSVSKSEIETSLPNILITNPDMMHFKMSNFWNHSFFGKPLARCKNCYSRDYNPTKLKDEKSGKCRKCAGEVELVQSRPEFLVVDEVHLFRGSFGSNVGTLVSELSHIVSQYSGAEPMVVGASATIEPGEVKKVGQHLLGKEPIFVPTADIYERKTEETEIKRTHLFLMPQGQYWRYTVYGIALAIDEYRKELGQKIPTLIFANTVKDANNLERAIGEYTGMVTRAHTAELSKASRQRIEDGFSKGDVEVIAATKTLEVGVDFDNIKVLILVGAPFSYNDFIQRIGRAGRGNDPSLVITLLRPFIPLDSYYFENCRELLDPDSGLLEAFPIQRNNPYIIRRHIRDAILSMVYTLDRYGATSYYTSLRRDMIGAQPKFIAADIESWLQSVFIPSWLDPNDRPDIESTIRSELSSFYEHLQNRQPKDSNETTSKHFERDLHFSLRTNDQEVSVTSPTDPEKILRLTADRLLFPSTEEDDLDSKEEEAEARSIPDEPELHVGTPE